MGICNSYYIDANIDDEETIIKINFFLGTYCAGADWAWRNWTGPTKWEIGDLTEISNKFLNIIFSLEVVNDIGSHKTFFTNGLAVEEKFAIPTKWPSQTDI